MPGPSTSAFLIERLIANGTGEWPVPAHEVEGTGVAMVRTQAMELLRDGPLQYIWARGRRAQLKTGAVSVAVPTSGDIPPSSTRLVARHPCNGRPLCSDSDYECPRPSLPRCDSSTCDSSESEGTRSRSASPVSSGLPTTPTPSPTAESYDVAAELKGSGDSRAVSPVPPPRRSLSASTSTLPAADECEEENDDAWQDDDEYYAAHAGSFITLAPPLPPSFPASPSCESSPMSAALPSSRALQRESAIIPPSVSTSASTASTKRAWVCLSRTPAVRASTPTGAPPPPLIVTSAYCHSYTLAVTPPRVAGLVALKNARPAKDAPPDGRAEPPWSGDWSAYAPFGTPSPSSSQHSHSSDSNSAYSTGSSSSERLVALLSPSAQRRFPAETQGVLSDVSSSSEWEEAWRRRAAVAAGRVCLVFSFSVFVSSVPVPYRGEMALPALAPPAPQPRVRIHTLSLISSNGGAGAPLSLLVSPFPLYLRALLLLFSLSLLRPGTRPAAVPTRPRTRTAALPLALVLFHALLRALRPRTPLPRRRVRVAEDVRVRAGGGVRRYAHMHLPCAKSPTPSSFAKGYGMKTKLMGSATVLSTPKRKGKDKGGKRLTVEDVCVVIAPAPAPAPPATPTTTPTCGASTPRQRWSYSSRASASSARVLPSPSGSGSESDSWHQRLRLRERLQRGERGDAEEADPSAWLCPSDSRSLIAIVLFLERVQARGVSDTTGELPGSSCGDFLRADAILAGRQSLCVALESKSKRDMCLEVGRVLAVLLPP
ncbi:hypothetical protein B0H14DRAFT_3695126 [Mycena olivaceomarginata]|nr:hypothetical protein B0H14DRAFT_3695126 [Mycena olivaceomarginata]